MNRIKLINEVLEKEWKEFTDVWQEASILFSHAESHSLTL